LAVDTVSLPPTAFRFIFGTVFVKTIFINAEGDFEFISEDIVSSPASSP
jgi:hypothetical protein